MSEEEWLTTTDPTRMLVFPIREFSHRKRRLYAFAVCKTVWDNFPSDQCRAALEASELFADGLIEVESLRHALVEAYQSAHVESEKQNFEGCAWIRLSVGAAFIHVIVPEFQGTASILREIIGNPFRPVAFDPAWRTSTAVGVAETIYADRTFGDLPILADALQDAGCDHPDILAHLRGPGPHVRGCWALDLVLGKE